MEGLRVRVVEADVVLSPCIVGLDVRATAVDGRSINRIPIVRLFGSTSAGQRVCVHLHRTLPYFYVPLPPAASNPDQHKDDPHYTNYLRSFALSLDAKIAQASRSNANQNANYQHASASALPGPFVYRVAVVRGIPFYGYHPHEQLFLKIFLLDPTKVAVAAEQLRNFGMIPHEAHVPFLLQVMIDLNLAGMNVVTFNKVQFRLPLPRVSGRRLRYQKAHWTVPPLPADDSAEYLESNITDAMCLPTYVRKTSECELEVDVLYEHVAVPKREKVDGPLPLDGRGVAMNGTQVDATHPKFLVRSLSALWETERKRRLAVGLSSQLPPIFSQERSPLPNTKRQSAHQQRLHEVVDQLDPATTVHDDDQDKKIFQLGFEAAFDCEAFSREAFSRAPRRAADLDPVPPSDPGPQPVFEAMDMSSGVSIDYDRDGEHEDHEQHDDRSTPQAKRQRTIEHLIKRSEQEFLDGEASEQPKIWGLLEMEQHEAGLLDSEGAQSVDWDDVLKCLNWMRDDRATDGQDNLSDHDEDDDNVDSDHFHERMDNKADFAPTTTTASEEVTVKQADYPASAGESESRSSIDELLAQLSGTALAAHPLPPPPPLPQASTVIPSTISSSQLNVEVPSNARSIPVSHDDEATAGQMPVVSSSGDDYVTPVMPVTVVRKLPNTYTTNPFASHILLHITPPTSPTCEDMVLPEFGSQSDIDESVDGSAAANDYELLSSIAFATGRVLSPKLKPPSSASLLSTLNQHGRPFEHVSEHYSKRSDVTGPRTFNNRKFNIPGPRLPEWLGTAVSREGQHVRSLLARQMPARRGTTRILTPLKRPPHPYLTRALPDPESDIVPVIEEPVDFDVPSPAYDSTLAYKAPARVTARPPQISPMKKPATISQLEGPTVKPFSTSMGGASAQAPDLDVLHTCIMCVEIYAASREHLMPDPRFDQLCGIFYCIRVEEAKVHGFEDVQGAIILVGPGGRKNSGKPSRMRSGTLDYVTTELGLFDAFVSLVRFWDPDFICGFEIHKVSLGYILERAKVAFNFDLCSMLSRTPGIGMNSFDEGDAWGRRKTNSMHIAGRLILNIWRIMRQEIALNIYTFGNLCWHVLQRRVPDISFQTLTRWFGDPLHCQQVLDYMMSRTVGVMELIDKRDVIGRTSELALVFGIRYFDVDYRGSQFRVESIMLRLAKPLHYICMSPSRRQVESQHAAECIPLNMEPETKLYNSPVLVLDFQSLYPSIMIAYNYCYSTCLGRISRHRHRRFGVTSLDVAEELIAELKDQVDISPNGVVFVKEHIRKGVLPQMLLELLETRQMYKRTMKDVNLSTSTRRRMDSRQLALKLLANVTYGYTSANFSGRMPCVDIADSIVETARERLEEAIRFVEAHKEWNAHVVYGDTDSMFVSLEGRSREEAHRIGAEIADTITRQNRKPIKLKFEKVYLPCMLQAKKRYVGFMYESPTQVDPVFDAKGIETVRRDTCPAVSKMLERTLKLIFTTKDMSSVKQYVQHQFQRILDHRVSSQEFIFATELRDSYKNPEMHAVPMIAAQMRSADPRSYPETGERVPYVVTATGPVSVRVIDGVVSAREAIMNPSLRPDAHFYISRRIIPALDRFLTLIGCSAAEWYASMPRVERVSVAETVNAASSAFGKGHLTGAGGAVKARQQNRLITGFMTSSRCVICSASCDGSHGKLCDTCSSDPALAAVLLSFRIRSIDLRHDHLHQICVQCTTNSDVARECVSLDCPIFVERIRARDKLLEATQLDEILGQLQ